MTEACTCECVRSHAFPFPLPTFEPMVDIS